MELKNLGFANLGNNVQISRYANIYTAENIVIGSNVRIDDFVVMSGVGGICIGDYVHIGAHSTLYGKYGIDIDSFVTISGKVSIFSVSDDYSGEYMTGPMIDQSCVKIVGGKVVVEKNVIIGTHSAIMPGVILAEGTAVGAMSFVKESTLPYSIYAGVPAKFVRKRDTKMQKIELQYYPLPPPPQIAAWSYSFRCGKGGLMRECFIYG